MVVHDEHDIDVAWKKRAIKTSPALRPEIETEAQDILPDDVLSRIFVLISQDHGYVLLPMNRNPKTPPQLVLSHVCSRWRSLALSTFELWNNVRFVNQGDDCVRLLLRSEWLSRVGSSPIRLWLRPFISFWDDDDTSSRVTQEIISHFRLQIKTLQIDLTFRQLKALSSFPKSILPHIETLGLEFGSCDANETFSRAPISFTRLRSVILREGYYSRSSISDVLLNIPLPWSQLRNLTLFFQARDLMPIFHTLRQMPHLQDLSLHLQLHNNFDHLERLSIPSLRCICLELCITNDIMDEGAYKVLRNITCPDLVELDMKRTNGHRKETYEIIKQQYNLQGLEVLSLINPTISASSILENAPKLQRLHIRGDMIDDAAIVGLSNGTLGRCLRELTIRNADDTGRLISMVEMRKRTVDRLIENKCNWSESITALRHVEIYCHHRSEYKERVGALKKVGISVMLH